MPALLDQLRSTIGLARAEHAAAAAEIAADNLRRLIGLAAVMLVVSVLHILSFQAPRPDDLPYVRHWKHMVLGLHQGMLVLVALLGATALWLRQRGRSEGPASRLCALLASVLALAFPAALSVVDQQVTPNITPFVIGCFMAGVVFLHRPLTLAAVYGFALVAFSALLGLTQQDPQLLLSNRVNALSAAVLGWTLGMLTWRKTTQNLSLRRQLVRRQQELEAKQQELQHLATHDGLTGLLNRAEVERLCRLELLRAQRHGLPLSALVLDMDNFKQINDRWGHPAGDAVLVAVAQVLRESVRATDVVGRMGGEEFMVLLPHSNAAAAQVLADKLRRAMAGLAVPIGADRIRLTASLGLATALPGVETQFDSLYQRADRALYRAKAAGRDRVEMA